MSGDMEFPGLHRMNPDDVIKVIDPQPGRRLYITGNGGTAPIKASELYEAVVYWNTRERREKLGEFDWNESREIKRLYRLLAEARGMIKSARDRNAMDQLTAGEWLNRSALKEKK